MTSAAGMTTARTFRMAIGTGIAAIVVAFLFNCLAGVNNT
jgi:hypothetical protein